MEGLRRAIRGTPRARLERFVRQEGWNGRGRLAEDEGLQAPGGGEQMGDRLGSASQPERRPRQSY